MSTGSRGNTFWRAPEAVRRTGHARPWLGLAAALALVAGLLLFGDSGWLAVRSEQQAVSELRHELERTQRESAAVRARNAELLQPGSEELERIAREEFRMRREGEEVHHLVGGAGSDADAPDPPRSGPRP